MREEIGEEKREEKKEENGRQKIEKKEEKTEEKKEEKDRSIFHFLSFLSSRALSLTLHALCPSQYSPLSHTLSLCLFSSTLLSQYLLSFRSNLLITRLSISLFSHRYFLIFLLILTLYFCLLSKKE